MIKLIFLSIILLQAVKAQQFVTKLGQSNEYNELLKCYLKRNLVKGSLVLDLVIFQMDYQWMNHLNATDPQSAYEIYPQTVHVFLYNYAGDDHSMYGQLVGRALKNQPIKAVWVSVSYNIESCVQLIGFLRDITNALGPETTVGIITNQGEWNSRVNKGFGCSQVPQKYPLFYRQYDSQRFSAFSSFSGWKKANYLWHSTIITPNCQNSNTISITYYGEPNQ